MPQRIAIFGISGSGKSTFARQLANQLKLPLYHTDSYEWLPGWQEAAREAAMQKHDAIIVQPQWILEGWVEPPYGRRLQAADLVIDLDYTATRCAWQAFRRMMGQQKRSELPAGCIDRFSLNFFWTILTRQERQSINAALKAFPPATYLKFNGPRQTQQWLAGLQSESN